MGNHCVINWEIYRQDFGQIRYSLTALPDTRGNNSECCQCNDVVHFFLPGVDINLSDAPTTCTLARYGSTCPN